jgi:hypothetical protein
MKRIAVIQSNYIPWKGYFDIINMVDEFVFYDCVQYTKNDWRNRNKIKTNHGSQWLTIPVHVDSLKEKICGVQVSDPKWATKHWTFFKNLFLTINTHYLCEINHAFIFAINSLLGITTRIRHSSEFTLCGESTERLIDLLKQSGATSYLSGPRAKEYLMEPLFEQEHIALEWMDYEDYPEYNQPFSPFDHYVSIIDLLFNEGPNAAAYMKSFLPHSNRRVA